MTTTDADRPDQADTIPWDKLDTQAKLQTLRELSDGQAVDLADALARLATLEAGPSPGGLMSWLRQPASTRPRQGKIYGAMARAFAAVEQVGKSQVDAGPGGKFMAKTIDEVYRVVRSALADAAVFVVPETDEWTSDTRTTSGNKVVHREDVDVHVWFVADDGSGIRTGPWKGRGEDFQDKSHPKAYSYALKAALIGTFLVPGEPEPDANAPGETVAADDADQAALDREVRARGWISYVSFREGRQQITERVKGLPDHLKGPAGEEIQRILAADGETWDTMSYAVRAKILDALERLATGPSDADDARRDEGKATTSEETDD